MHTILIVEDEEALTLALKDSFEAEGYSVDTAPNGEEAMNRINNKRPDIVLLDLLMPKKDGLFVLQEIKKSPNLKTIPVIVLSNVGGDMKLPETGADISPVAMYADDYLIKSQHSIDEIVARVKKYMNKKGVPKAALAAG